MAFQLPDLPFAKDALAPHMSAETLEYHHGKHHRAYVNKTNELIESDARLSGASLLQVVKEAKRRGEQQAVQQQRAAVEPQLLLAVPRTKPGAAAVGKLAKLIEDGFGNAETMLQKLHEEAVNHFASGWAWLVLDRGSLRITSLHDADTPAVHEGMVPLFTLDVWEHAYYIDYRNERPKFASAVLQNIVNWDFVGENLDGNGLERANQHEGASTARADLS